MDEIPQNITQHRKQVKKYYSTRGAEQIFNYDEYTCSEHYSPYYGHLIGDRVAEIAKKYRAYQLIEVGGGRGRFAFDILSRLRERHQDVFKQLSYTLLDISYPLQICQIELLKDFSVEFITASATHLPFNSGSLHNSIIISNEVLADLPSVIPTKKRDIPADVRDLAVKANINLKDDSYFNVGAFQFLLEIHRILSSGVVIIIEYGVDKDPKPRTLGGEGSNHIEVAINKKDLSAAAGILFSDVTVGPLIDLIGEGALSKMIKKLPVDLPNVLINWLFDLVWMTEHLSPKRLKPQLLNKIFVEEDHEGEAALEMIKYWQERLVNTKVTNNYERMFLENLSSLFIVFDEMFGRQAAIELLKGFQRLHQLGTKIFFNKTMYADRDYLDKGYIDEDFFFLLCRV